MRAMDPMTEMRRLRDWLFQDRHRQIVRKLRSDIYHAFTDHPYEAGETFFKHLCFTLRMSAWFFYISLVILIHGLFPFLLTREASQQIDKITALMKSRQPDAQNARKGEHDV